MSAIPLCYLSRVIARKRASDQANRPRRNYVDRSEVPPGWLSRAKLAQAAGVTRATVKHYNELGLLFPPLFTGRNMAYYDPACVERIRLVRELRSQRHLPLQVIAGMLESEGAERVVRELQRSRLLRADLVEALAGERLAPITRRELLSIPGIDERVLAELEEIGLVHSLPEAEGERYDPLSLKVARAVGVMREEGLTEEAGFRVSDLRLYRERLDALVQAEVRLFNSRVAGRFDSQTEERYMRAALIGADALVLAVRDRLLTDLLEDGAPARRPGRSRRGP